ncbi:MAG: hypothetical protein ACLTKI_08970, partial [Lachnospiraceae bacterium]
MPGPNAKDKELNTSGQDIQDVGEQEQQEQNTDAAAEEASDVEERPSGETESSTPSESGGGETEESPKPVKVRTEAEMNLHHAKGLVKKYNGFKNKYVLSKSDVRAHKKQSIERDEMKLAEYRIYAANLDQEGKKERHHSGRHKQKIAGKIMDAVSRAEININQATKDMQAAEIWYNLQPVYNEVDDMVSYIKNRENEFRTPKDNANLIMFIKEKEAARKALSSNLEDAGLQGKFQMFDERMKELKHLQRVVEFGMPQALVDQSDKLVRRREKASDIQKSLNETYTERTPIVRLIRHANKVAYIGGEVEKEEKDITYKAEKADEYGGDLIGVVDDVLNPIFGDDDSRSSTMKALGAVWEVMKGEKSMDEAAKESSNMSKVLGFLAPALKIFILVQHFKEFIKNNGDMSEEEKIVGVDGLAEETIGALLGSGQAIIECIKEIPFLGPMFGLIADGVGVIVQYRAWKRANGHMKEAHAEKEAVKKKMLAKKEKYAAMGVTTDGGKALFGFMGTRLEDASGIHRGQTVENHVHKRTSKKSFSHRNDHEIKKSEGTFEDQELTLRMNLGAAGGANLSAEIARMKKSKDEGTLSDADRRRYYQMKTLSLMNEYKEMDEAQIINKNRRRQGAKELIHIALDAMKNILTLVPGVNSVIASAIGIVNTASRYMEKGALKLQQKGREKGWLGFNAERSETKKKINRTGMAEDLLGRMMLVGQYM